MKQRILFACIGNVCRSPMAEGFARAYGLDCIEASSGGFSPGAALDPYTKTVMEERGIDISRHQPKMLEEALRHSPTLIINMSGRPLPHYARGILSEDWTVRDPIGEAIQIHREVRDAIEAKVMDLVLRIRTLHAPSRQQRMRMGRLR